MNIHAQKYYHNCILYIHLFGRLVGSKLKKKKKLNILVPITAKPNYSNPLIILYYFSRYTTDLDVFNWITSHKGYSVQQSTRFSHNGLFFYATTKRYYIL